MPIQHILITGGADYIGSLLTGTLLNRDCHVTAVDDLLFGGETLLGYWHHPQCAPIIYRFATLFGLSPRTRFPIHIIPNGLNTERFQPISRDSARQTLGLDQHMPVVLFSAHLVTEPRKGSALLKVALERLAQTNIPNLTLLIMGANAEKLDTPDRFLRKCLGFVQDDSLLAMAYSAADIFVFPTLAENLPNGVLESMACGTPSVAFNVGGVPEAVRHLETGYLAEYKNIDDLVKGIELLLSNTELRSRLSQRCREVAVREYSLELQAHRFFELYTAVLEVNAADKKQPNVSIREEV